MTLPSKGRRSVEVDGRRYHWLIRKHGSRGQVLRQFSMLLAAEPAEAETPGTLHVNLCISRPDNEIHPHQTSVTPRMVREMILSALEKGWAPDGGGRFELVYPLSADRV